MIPGRALHRLSAQICSAKTLERVVEPAIADLQKEYASAGLASRRAWVLLAGYAAILKAIVMCAVSVPASDDERRAIANALAWSAAMFVVVSALLILLPLYSFQNIPRGWYEVTTLVPQAVPLAIPIGIAFGIAFGLHARPATRIRKLVLVCALGGSVLSFGILAWAMPAGNQAFKERTLHKLWGSGYHGAITEPWQAHNEMNLSQLRHQITTFSERGEPNRARHFAFRFHLRFALAAATLALASVLLAAPFNHRGLRALIAFAACFVYLALLYTGEALAVSGTALPPVAAAWLPNVVLIAFAIFIASWRDQEAGHYR